MEPKTVAELQLRHIDTPIDLSSNNILLSVLFEFCIWQLVLVAILGLCTGGHWVARSMRPESWESRSVFPCAVPNIWQPLEQASGLAGLRAESLSAFTPPALSARACTTPILHGESCMRSTFTNGGFIRHIKTDVLVFGHSFRHKI